MTRRTRGWTTLRAAVVMAAGVVLVAGAVSVTAQERPALLFSETWQQAESALGRPTSPHRSDNQYYLAGQSAVGNGSLEVGLYGEKSGDITVYEHEGRIDLWTGLAGSPVAVTLSHSSSYLDLTGLARVRAIVRTNNLHRLHPVVRLADGTMLIGSQVIDTQGAFLAVEVAFDNQRWFALDPAEVAVGSAVAEVDLGRVDEVGFANLSPGGGHGNAGWSNISTVEVYAAAVPRM
jgi:hypothetical protein